MSVKFVGLQDFDWRDYEAPSVFDCAGFTHLNSYKVKRVLVAAGHGLAQILGETEDGCLNAPFSAPYAMPLRALGKHHDYRSFAAAVVDASQGHIELTPAPAFHTDADAWTDALDRLELRRIDNFNYHLTTADITSGQLNMSKMACRNLKRALSVGFELRMTHDAPAVYDFLAEHHRALGYRMAMSRQAVCDTAAVVPVDFFEVMLGGERVAAAIYYRVAPDIVQLINWGDALAMRQHRTSSFLAHAIFAHYAADGHTRIIDLGPASTDGIRNESLITFKLGLGAIETVKPTYRPL